SVLAGSGGRGARAIGALPGGAARAVLVERDHAGVKAVRRNLASTRLRDRARVQDSTVATFLAGKLPAERPFDLVFLDPPYAAGAAELGRVLGGLDRTGWVADSATLVVERGSAAAPVPSPRSL